MEVKKVSIVDFEGMLMDGTIQDCCTLASWGLYRLWKERQPQAVTAEEAHAAVPRAAGG